VKTDFRQDNGKKLYNIYLKMTVSKNYQKMKTLTCRQLTKQGH